MPVHLYVEKNYHSIFRLYQLGNRRLTGKVSCLVTKTTADCQILELRTEQVLLVFSRYHGTLVTLKVARLLSHLPPPHYVSRIYILYSAERFNDT